jgi:hypothetical protein
MAEEPVVAWVTAHGNLGTVLNAVKSADIPVDDRRCYEWALNRWWGLGRRSSSSSGQIGPKLSPLSPLDSAVRCASSIRASPD